MRLHFAFLIAIASILTGARPALADAAADKARSPVPSAADRAKADKTVRELFRSDFSRQDGASRKALAAKLLTEATQGEDLPTRYVLLQDSCDLAASAGDVNTAFRALDAMASTFAVDGPELKSAALATAARSAATPADAAALASATMSLADDAFAAGHFDMAVKLAGQAETDAKAAKDVALFAAARAKADEARAALREVQKAKPAVEKLRQHPDDAGANLTVGKLLCFVMGNWDEGLAHLSAGSDPSLAAAAKQDLANPAEADGQLSVGDAWWALSQDPKSDAKTGAARRAAFWYRKAVPELSGLKKTTVQKRLWAAARAGDGAGLTPFKFLTDDNTPLLLPMNDPSPDVLTLTQEPTAVHISGTKTFDVATVAGKTHGHFGKAICIARPEAGGSLRATIINSHDHISYYLLITDKHNVTRTRTLDLDKNEIYSWQVAEKDGNITLEVAKEDKVAGSISLPSSEFKSFGLGATVRWPTDKADLIVSFD
ncbi:MAG TPA: hypothetical protein VG269_04350 [Tepidisphaeraceae bacterium]|nr:hypothetical protein [Tepidisphaeraceae bacterium]